MDMIGHKTIGPHVYPELAQLLPKHVAVKQLISIPEENCLATISALGHVVRKARDDHSGEPTHARKIPRTPVNGYAVTGLFPGMRSTLYALLTGCWCSGKGATMPSFRKTP
jgi:hypothetical protein